MTGLSICSLIWSLSALFVFSSVPTEETVLVISKTDNKENISETITQIVSMSSNEQFTIPSSSKNTP